MRIQGDIRYADPLLNRKLTVITETIVDKDTKIIVVIKYRPNIGITNEVGGIISMST